MARQKEWLRGTMLPLTFRTNEMAGELGEVAELLMDRWRPGQQMYGAWVTNFADELSDVAICGDLVGYYAQGPRFDYDLLEGRAGLHGMTDYKWCTKVMRHMGLMCNAAKKRDRQHYVIAGADPDADVMGPLCLVMQLVYDMAHDERINMERAVASKFNKTSKKVGLQTLYIPPGIDRALLIQ